MHTLEYNLNSPLCRYWLPSFNKHPHIALRFVPQASYEYAAPLEVSPKPDVLTRLFMLFGGVKTDELPRWKASIDRAKENVQMCTVASEVHGLFCVREMLSEYFRGP